MAFKPHLVIYLKRQCHRKRERGPAFLVFALWLLPLFIPKGFKLIAVGERCATPTDLIDRDSDPEGVTLLLAV